jgi:hypothetical protein
MTDADTIADLKARLEVAEQARDFWYRNYVGASEHMHRAITQIVNEALAQDFKADPDCEKLLRKREKQLQNALAGYFKSPGLRTGLTSIPCSLLGI